MTELHNFKHLKDRIQSWDIQILDESMFGIIKGVNFEKAYKAGAISFDRDGIYIEYKGELHKGYMFIKEPWIEMHGSYPKFHVRKCQIIQNFIDDGNFNQRYEFSQHSVNDLVDITSKNIYKDQELEICGYCRRLILDEVKIDTTSDFFKSLNIDEVIEHRPTDIDGYVVGWKRISADYKKSKNHCCENCGITPNISIDRQWWHTHHINGDKEINEESNLMCLCIACHANVDEIHKQNFNSGTRKIELDSFIKKYRDRLIELGNPYI